MWFTRFQVGLLISYRNERNLEVSITEPFRNSLGDDRSLLRPNSGSTSVPFFSLAADGESGLPVDTVTDEDGRVFLKYHVNDVFPDHVLIYRYGCTQ